MRRGSGDPGRQPGTAAANTQTNPLKGPAQNTAPGYVEAIAVYPANHGKVMSTVAVYHSACRQVHLHRTKHLSAAGHLRRATCGHGKYRIVVADAERRAAA